MSHHTSNTSLHYHCEIFVFKHRCARDLSDAKSRAQLTQWC